MLFYINYEECKFSKMGVDTMAKQCFILTMRNVNKTFAIFTDDGDIGFILTMRNVNYESAI